MINPVGIIIFLSSFFIGIKFPDFDFKFKLRHRNILTHSPLIVVPLMYLYKMNQSNEFRYFIMGLSLSIGVHLIFDIFPKGWGGGALLQLPFIKYSFNKRRSQLLIFIFIIASFVLTLIMCKGIFDYYMCALISIGVIVKDSKKEEKIVRPLLTFVSIFLLLGSFKYSEVENINKNVYNNLKKMVENTTK